MLQYVWLNLPELWDWKAISVLHFQYEKPWQADHPKAAALKPLIELWRTSPRGMPCLISHHGPARPPDEHVLVSGGTGMVGRFVVERLIADGAAVMCLGRTPPPAGFFSRPVRFHPGRLDPAAADPDDSAASRHSSMPPSTICPAGSAAAKAATPQAFAPAMSKGRAAYSKPPAAPGSPGSSSCRAAPSMASAPAAGW